MSVYEWRVLHVLVGMIMCESERDEVSVYVCSWLLAHRCSSSKLLTEYSGELGSFL